MHAGRPTAPPAEARRLTGPNLFAAASGAVADVVWPAGPPPAEADACAARWADAVRDLAARLGWPAPAVVVRRAEGPRDVLVSHYLSAPEDQLDAAVDAAELAWAAAASGGRVDDAAAEALASRAAAARNPRLTALLGEAERRGLPACWDDDRVTVGAGARGRTYPTAAIPDAADVPWAALGAIPCALVTGSNGKTTVTRVAAAVLRAAGHAVGYSTTDEVRVRGAGVDAELDAGDWAGPGGARLVLADRRATAAVLETARGGMLRRGLAVRRATAACVTNLAEDHFGEYGVHSLAQLADAKLVVTRALVPTGGPLVAAADDGTLRARAAALDAAPHPVWWTAADPDDADAQALVAAAAAAGRPAGRVRGGAFEWHDGRAWAPVLGVADAPVTAGGAARHNVANALAALGVAFALGATAGDARAALAEFGRAAGDNPGRLEVIRVGGVTVLVDYAHNPAGLTALLDAAAAMPARRRLLVLGQAGDRDDEALGGLARVAWGHARGGRRTVDRILLKEAATLRRGRRPGDVVAVLRGALAAAGAPDDAVDAEVMATEREAAGRALAWAAPGDVLLLPLHEERAAVLAWLAGAAARGSGLAGRPVG